MTVSSFAPVVLCTQEIWTGGHVGAAKPVEVTHLNGGPVDRASDSDSASLRLWLAQTFCELWLHRETRESPFLANTETTCAQKACKRAQWK